MDYEQDRYRMKIVCLFFVIGSCVFAVPSFLHAKGLAKPKMQRIFEAAKSRGVEACHEYLEGSPDQMERNLDAFRACVMWTAYHRKSVIDCKELNKVKPDRLPERATRVYFYRCIGVVAARTGNSSLCKEQVIPEEVEKCVSYSKSEVELDFWNTERWNIDPIE